MWGDLFFVVFKRVHILCITDWLLVYTQHAGNGNIYSDSAGHFVQIGRYRSSNKHWLSEYNSFWLLSTSGTLLLLLHWLSAPWWRASLPMLLSFLNSIDMAYTYKHIGPLVYWILCTPSQRVEKWIGLVAGDPLYSRFTFYASRAQPPLMLPWTTLVNIYLSR